MHHKRTSAERWRDDATKTGGIPLELILIGARLIEQAELDRRYRDYRLTTLLGDDWYARMIRFASSRPRTARRVWLHMINHRRLPSR